MTHDDLRTLLPRYAAGELDETEAGVVRAHLATGCPECLDTVFQPHADRVPAVPRVSAPASQRRLVRGLGVLAMLFAAATGWMVGLLGSREAAHRVEAKRTAEQLSALDRARAELQQGLDAAAAARAAAEAEAARQAERARDSAEAARESAEAARASAEASMELTERLAAAEARVAELSRGVRSREAEIGRLLAGAEVRALGDLAATPGVQVLRLTAAPAASGARGHVLWHPARERIVLYVFDLPTDARYHVRVLLDDGSVAAVPVLRLGLHGEAATAIELGVRAARLRQIAVVREPDDVPVLDGRLPAAG